MDTTGAHINGSATPKGEFSKDELSAILKFGAQNMSVLDLREVKTAPECIADTRQTTRIKAASSTS